MPFSTPRGLTHARRAHPHPAASPCRRPRPHRGGRLHRREILEQLGTEHPALRERLFDGDELRRFVNVYVNNEDIRYLDDLATPVAENDEVSIIPAVAGG